MENDAVKTLVRSIDEPLSRTDRLKVAAYLSQLESDADLMANYFAVLVRDTGSAKKVENYLAAKVARLRLKKLMTANPARANQIADLCDGLPE